VTTSCEGILLNTLQASSMLPHFAYIIYQTISNKDIWIPTVWMVCWCAHLPSSSATTHAHAFSTPTKVTESSCTLSCCICQNRSSAFCPCPHFSCPDIITFQVTTSCEGIS
jgi:hypothetical protein